MRGRKPRSKSDDTLCALSCPAFLTQIAKKEWRRVYGLLSERKAIANIDSAVLAGYAQCYSRWREAERALDLHGVIVEETSVSRAGITRTTLRKNPACTASKEAQATMLRYIAALGLSPADRTRIVNDAPEPEDNISELLSPPGLDAEDDECD
jgi:P27 family predicted phage terminase small subunit